ncbi:hypothetical protein OPQ81_006440 [Rhizoctonia solani]|nr:hypothetical protein OPQ81_006440 [Rhizoctonia solani]
MTINSLPVLHDYAEKKSAGFRNQARDHVPSFDTHASVLSSESPLFLFLLAFKTCNTDSRSAVYIEFSHSTATQPTIAWAW